MASNVKKRIGPGVISVLCFCSMLGIAGCESPTVTHEQAQTVLASRIDIRQQLTLTKSQLDRTVAALNAINGKQTDDLVMAFNKYGNEVDLLVASVAEVNRASMASKAEAQTYFDTAEAKIALIQDPALKSRAIHRRERALSLAQSIDDETRLTEAGYKSFIQKLHDIQAYLAADLTFGSVQSIRDQFSQTNADVAPLKTRSDQLTFALELANELMNTGATSEPTTEPASRNPLSGGHPAMGPAPDEAIEPNPFTRHPATSRAIPAETPGNDSMTSAPAATTAP